MAWLVVAVAQPCGETVVVAGETAQQELEAQSFADACEQLFSVCSGELLGGLFLLALSAAFPIIIVPIVTPPVFGRPLTSIWIHGA